MADDEIDIPIRFTPEGVDETVSGTARVRQEIEQLGGTTAVGASDWKQMRTAVNEGTGEMRMAIAPVRSLSWDFMLMGRGMSVLNHYLLGNNKALQEAIGIVYTIGAVTRIFVAIQDLMILKRTIEIMLLGREAAAHLQNAAAIGVETAAKVAGSAVGGPVGGAAAGGIVSILGRLIMGGSYQKGGIIPETGVYMLHKGETVTPAGGGYTQIVINMNSGPISSSIDVDNMLDAMALKMAQESRRRLGR